MTRFMEKAQTEDVIEALSRLKIPHRKLDAYTEGQSFLHIGIYGGVSLYISSATKEYYWKRTEAMDTDEPHPKNKDE